MDLGELQHRDHAQACREQENRDEGHEQLGRDLEVVEGFDDLSLGAARAETLCVCYQVSSSQNSRHSPPPATASCCGLGSDGSSA